MKWSLFLNSYTNFMLTILHYLYSIASLNVNNFLICILKLYLIWMLWKLQMILMECVLVNVLF
jgi:hypothetical protein